MNLCPPLQAKKTKEVLSANTEAPIGVEELHNGIDFRSRITRQGAQHCELAKNVNVYEPSECSAVACDSMSGTSSPWI